MLTNLVKPYYMAITHYLLTSLSVLGSSASDGGFASPAALTILCIYVAHPTGSFLTVGDGVFSMEGLEPDFPVPNILSSKLEELHQQCDLPHLSQNSQYLPRNLLPVLLLLLPPCGALPLHTWGL